MAFSREEIKQRLWRHYCDTSDMGYVNWLERRLLSQAGYVADMQRQMKARIEAGELPDPLLLTTIGGMAKNLLMTEQL